jgi:hypothetical protein
MRRRGRILFVDLLRGRGFLKPARGHRRRLLIRPQSLFSLVWDGTLQGRDVIYTKIENNIAVNIRAYPRRGK